MKFTIARAELESLLKAAGITRPKTPDKFKLSACAARVFVELKGDVAGLESLVLSDGAVTVPAKKFIALLQTYKGTRHLTFEGGPSGLKVQNFTMPILAWNPRPSPPASFQISRGSSTSTLLPSGAPAAIADSPKRV